MTTKTDNLVALFDQSDGRSIEPIEFGAHVNSQSVSPTLQVSREWQSAFDFFNKRLFKAKLPDCLITFTRVAGAHGYFRAEAFRDRDDNVAHEIALNPSYFGQCDVETFATLVHEMAHLWRHLYGRRNRKSGQGAPGYHDAVWANRMEAIGLMPSDTGKPGGQRTGYHMLDYPIDGGLFDLASRELLISGMGVNWRDARIAAPDPSAEVAAFFGVDQTQVPQPSRRKTRIRFTCPGCDLRLWTRRNADLSCNPCKRPLIAR